MFFVHGAAESDSNRNRQEIRRASVVWRGDTLTGMIGISEVVSRSLSREYVEMAGEVMDTGGDMVGIFERDVL